MQWIGRSVTLVLAAAIFSGCAQPRVITSITGAEDQMKFVYARGASFFTSAETGMIQCNVQPDGQLSGCRQIPITFSE